MNRRRITLGIIAAAVLLFDGFVIYERYFRANAALTYVGLDSRVVTVPLSLRAARLREGKWDVDPVEALDSKYYGSLAGGGQEPMAFVSLGPDQKFGQAIRIIRNLKARGVCHVIIRESGNVVSPEIGIDIFSLILCGHAYGEHAAFEGTLPADRMIHVDERPGA